jgi:hypothetical protein
MKWALERSSVNQGKTMPCMVIGKSAKTHKRIKVVALKETFSHGFGCTKQLQEPGSRTDTEQIYDF